MNAYFVAAAVLPFAVGGAHSVLGEVVIFRRLRAGGLVPTQGGALLRERHVRILWASWHVLTVLGWALAVLLLRWPTAAAAPATGAARGGRRDGGERGTGGRRHARAPPRVARPAHGGAARLAGQSVRTVAARAGGPASRRMRSALRALGRVTQAIDSPGLVNAPVTAAALRDQPAVHLEPLDRRMVAELTGTLAARGPVGEVWDCVARQVEAARGRIDWTTSG
jgi:hypothetical protein